MSGGVSKVCGRGEFVAEGGGGFEGFLGFGVFFLADESGAQVGEERGIGWSLGERGLEQLLGLGVLVVERVEAGELAREGGVGGEFGVGAELDEEGNRLLRFIFGGVDGGHLRNETGVGGV